MDDKNKTFEIPEAQFVSFTNEDIITESAGTDGWDKDNNTEVWG